LKTDDSSLFVILKWGIILLFFGLFTIGLFRFFILEKHCNLLPENKKWLQEKGHLVVAGDFTCPPLEYVNGMGQASGQTVELLQALGQEMGITVEFRSLPWDKAFLALEKGEVDLVQGINYSQASFHQCRLSRPYLLNSLHIFVQNKEKKIKKLADLRGKKVALTKKEYDSLHLESQQGVEFLLVDDFTKGLDWLLKGEVQAYVGDSLSTLHYLQKMKKDRLIKEVGPQLGMGSYCFAVKDDNIKLLNILNSGLFYLEQKGIKREIDSRWLEKLQPEKNIMFFHYSKEIFNIIVFFFLFASAFFYFWTRYLQKQVAEKSQELLESNHKLVLLNSISAILSQSLEVERVLSKALAQLVNSLGLVAGAVSWQDKTVPHFIVATAEGVSSSLAGQVVNQEFWQKRIWGSGEENKSDAYSYLSFPLKSREETLGIMGILAPDRNTLTTGTIKILANVANQFAVALENAQLYLKACRRMVELNTIREIGNELAAINDLEELAEKTVQIIHSAFHYQFCAIFLLNEEKDRVSYYAYSGIRPGGLSEEYLDFTKGVLGQALKSSEAVRIGERQLVVPLKFQGQVIGIIDAMYNGEGMLSEDDYFILTTLAQDIAVALKNAQFSRTLQQLSFLDGLTGIANRRCFEQTLQHEWEKALEKESFLSLIMLDVDCFKLYNDSYGHLGGDSCLKQVAQVLKSSLQKSNDFLARYGGEEFVVVLPETTLQAATVIAQSLKKAVSDLKIPHCQSPVNDYVTVSLGVATMKPQKDSNAFWLVKQADQALYQAKNSGRNRFVVWKEVK